MALTTLSSACDLCIFKKTRGLPLRDFFSQCHESGKRWEFDKKLPVIDEMTERCCRRYLGDQILDRILAKVRNRGMRYACL